MIFYVILFLTEIKPASRRPVSFSGRTLLHELVC